MKQMVQRTFATMCVAATSLAVAPSIMAAPPGEETGIDWTSVTVEHIDGVEDWTMLDDVGLALPLEEICPALTLWFDGACRDRIELENMFGMPTTHIMGSQHMMGAGAVLLNEPMGGGMFRRTIVSDTSYPVSAPVPTRASYAIQAELHQTVFDEGNSTYRVLEETFLPGAGPFLVLDGWSSLRYSVNIPRQQCSTGGACLDVAPPEATCLQVETLVSAAGVSQCLDASDFFAEALGFSLTWPGAVTIRRIPGSAASSATGVSAAATDAVGAILYPALTCDDEVRDLAFAGATSTCINVPPPPPSGGI